MEVFATFRDIATEFRESALVLGNLDGVHLGHRALLKLAAEKANHVSVMSFDPHPSKVVAPQFAPKMLTTRQQKVDLLKSADVSVLLLQKFDAEFASMAPDRFVLDILIDNLSPHCIVVGQDFSFGAKGQGKVALLRQLCNENDIEVHVPETVTHNNLVVSSTKVRQFLHEGRVAQATALLGHPYALRGEVVRGHQRGRGLGFPTANLKTDNELIPAIGVYTTYTQIGAARHPSITNVGLQPTMENSTGLCVETHVLDYDADLYGQTIDVQFVSRIRDERRFQNVEALRTQIAADIVEARQRFSK